MIPVEVAHFDVAAGTDAGRKGKNNEDQFSVSAYQMSVSNSTPSIFAIVADGIGGHQAGEVASNIAVEMISQAISESDGSQPHGDHGSSHYDRQPDNPGPIKNQSRQRRYGDHLRVRLDH
jgi:serine/threonine protein phosphatase PrpC